MDHRTNHRHRHARGRSWHLPPLAGRRDERALLFATLIVLVVALLLGGSAWPRHLGDLVVVVASLPLLVLMTGSSLPATGTRFERVFPSLVLLVVALQLVPMPPGMWSALPGRSTVEAVYRLFDRAPPWLPLSLTPSGTLATLLFAVPPILLFHAVRRLSREGRRRIVVVVIAAAVVDVSVSLAQSVFGPQSLWNLYGTATTSMSTGLFNSQNHYPAIVYMAIPFVASTALHLRRRTGIGLTVLLPATLVLFTVLLLGALLSRSRAGMALTVVSLATTALVFGIGSLRGRSIRALVIGAALACVPLLWAVDREFARIEARLDQNPIEDYRGTIFSTDLRAIGLHFPGGSGFGSFVDVYQTVEDPTKMISAFINFAHNEYLQIALEGGLPALVLSAMFFLWYGGRVVAITRSAATDPGVLEMRAAVTAITLVLLHSVVEYPLRTAALAAVFAVACAVLTGPPDVARRRIADAASTKGDGKKAIDRPGDGSSPQPLSVS